MRIMNSKGQALVELAISLTILLVLLSGAVEFGLAFFQFVQLRDAAQEGGINGSICQDEAYIRNRIYSASESPIRLAYDENVIVSFPKKENFEGGEITVLVQYKHKVFMPFMSKIIGEYLTLNASVTNTILTTSGCP